MDLIQKIDNFLLDEFSKVFDPVSLLEDIDEKIELDDILNETWTDAARAAAAKVRKLGHNIAVKHHENKVNMYHKEMNRKIAGNLHRSQLFYHHKTTKADKYHPTKKGYTHVFKHKYDKETEMRIHVDDKNNAKRITRIQGKHKQYIDIHPYEKRHEKYTPKTH